jgi:hypothetical protein
LAEDIRKRLSERFAEELMERKWKYDYLALTAGDVGIHSPETGVTKLIDQ